MSRVPRGTAVRTTVLVVVLSLSGLALITSGYTAAVLQELRVEARVDEDLRADAEEFRLLSSVGVDPDTGDLFASPSDLVRTAMERIIPARNEGVIGIVDGEVAFTSRGAPIALQDDLEFVEALGPAVVADGASFITIVTEATTYRAGVVPVRSPGTDTPEGETASELDSAAAIVMAYDLRAEKAVFGEVFTIYAVVAAVSLAVVGVVGWLMAGRLLRPIRVLAASARRIGREDLSERIPVTGQDDLADMTRSVNEMLDRLEGAFDAQRELVGDVSHELRTPLTVVRGHLELMDVDDGNDAREVRDLALDELNRMNRVVDDLSTLATVDHPGFVHVATTGWGTLTDEVYDKALALGQREWVIDNRAEGDVSVDRERITQAWLQLAANAVKFSQPGSEIGLGSRIDGDRALLWVRDNGAGVMPEDRERIFERFARAADRSTPGAGLGLAIVAAIAQAHGGAIRCDSVPGEGSTFTMTVPRHTPVREDA